MIADLLVNFMVDLISLKYRACKAYKDNLLKSQKTYHLHFTPCTWYKPMNTVLISACCGGIGDQTRTLHSIVGIAPSADFWMGQPFPSPAMRNGTFGDGCWIMCISIVGAACLWGSAARWFEICVEIAQPYLTVILGTSLIRIHTKLATKMLFSTYQFWHTDNAHTLNFNMVAMSLTTPTARGL